MMLVMIVVVVVVGRNILAVVNFVQGADAVGFSFLNEVRFRTRLSRGRAALAVNRKIARIVDAHARP